LIFKVDTYTTSFSFDNVNPFPPSINELQELKIQDPLADIILDNVDSQIVETDDDIIPLSIELQIKEHLVDNKCE